MAVLIKAPYSDPSLYDKYFLEAFEPEDLARIEARKAWVAQETAAYEMEHVLLKRRSLFYAGFLELPMKEEFIAKTLRFRKGRRLGDIVVSTPNQRLVSEDVRRVIETVDPEGDGHRFFPVNIMHKDGRPYDGTYFAWAVHRRLDALDPASPGLYYVDPERPETSGLFYVTGMRHSRESHWVKKDVIGNCCAWFDLRTNFGFFISDRLLEAFQENGFTGFDVGAEWAEV